MSDVLRGDAAVGERRFGLVVSRWNEVVTARLAQGALDVLLAHGARSEDVTRVSVPGAFEIPLAARALARGGDHAGIIALGCLIRGETPHFEFLSAEVTRGLGAVALEFGVPVGMGVVTAESVEQALERCGGRHGNKGAEAALVTIEMASLLAKLAR
jgi:6,7-dimethyl-8-ribityllumazine synthase